MYNIVTFRNRLAAIPVPVTPSPSLPSFTNKSSPFYLIVFCLMENNEELRRMSKLLDGIVTICKPSFLSLLLLKHTT